MVAKSIIFISLFIWFISLHGRQVTRAERHGIGAHQLHEVERDLHYASQLRCASIVSYITINFETEYKDIAGKDFDTFLHTNTSPVNRSTVLPILSERTISAYKALPVVLTGTNTGIGLGMTGNVSKVEKDTRDKRPAFTIPLNHPRQNGSFCAQMAKLAELGISSFYQHMREDYKLPYVTLVHNAVVHENGYVAQECGWLQPRMGCGNRILQIGRDWRRNITSTLKSSSLESEAVAWQSATSLQQALGNYLPIYDEVFIINALWDFNYYHFMVDSLTRLIPFYHYLRRHKNIKIHIREEERAAMNISNPSIMKWLNDSRIIRQRVFDLLEIPPERVISGPLIARKVYLPNDADCASATRGAVVLRLLSQVLQRQARRVIKTGACDASREETTHRQLQSRSKAPRGLHQPFQRSKGKPSGAGTRSKSTAAAPSLENKVVPVHAGIKLPASQANIVIQWRECTLPTPANETRINWRCFTDKQRLQLERAAEELFPQSKIVLANTTLSTPLACDIALYRTAHVVVGLHGAAMTNAMFLRPGAVLVEIVGGYDRRMPPVCGYYGPYAAVFGVHHFIYYYNGVLDADSLDLADVLTQAKSFYEALRARTPYTEYSVGYGRYDYNTTFVTPV